MKLLAKLTGEILIEYRNKLFPGINDGFCDKLYEITKNVQINDEWHSIHQKIGRKSYIDAIKLETSQQKLRQLYHDLTEFHSKYFK